jgi:outer membrane protein TolC
VNLSWNFFNGLATNANVRKAEIQVLLSENDLATGRRSVASDVEKAVAQLSTARAQARVATQTEQTAKEGLRLARTRQEVGVGTQLEVRDAELKLTQAQLTRVGSLVDGREAEAALRRAQGDSSI